MDSCADSVTDALPKIAETKLQAPRKIRNRIKFSSISKEIQLKIAERMDYFSQVEFEMSSRDGLHTVQKTNIKVVYNLDSVVVSEGFLAISTTLPLECPITSKVSKKVWIEWEKLCEMELLPRFSTPLFYFEDAEVHPFKEFSEKVEFDSSDVTVHIKGTTCPGAIVAKLLGMVNITKFKCDVDCCPVLFNFPDYLKIDHMEIFISKLPDEALRLLKSKVIIFKEAENSSRIAPTANLIFQQWISNERDITLFRIQGVSENEQEFSVEESSLLSGIPFTTIARPKETRVSEDFLTSVVESNDVIYKIEREDAKLAIFVCESKKTVQAQEFKDEKKIFDSFASLKFSE